MDTYLCAHMDTQRNKEATRQRLIAAAESIIENSGFESLKIRRIADAAGVNKTLIYRYFGSLSGLIIACMERHDFWLAMSGNTLADTTLDMPQELPENPSRDELRAYLRCFYRRQINHYRTDTMFRRLLRWELTSDNELVSLLRARREENGVLFTQKMVELAGSDPAQIRAISALVDAGIAYMSMLADSCGIYNGIDIASDSGWEQLTKSIDTLINLII